MKIRNPYDRTTHEINREVNKKPSKTIPDQTMSIPELIRRYAQGLPLGAPRVGTYLEEGEHDILNGKSMAQLDLSEQHAIIKSVKDDYKETTERIRQSRKKSNIKLEENDGNAQ